jgi:hypothetical protein
MPCSDFPCILIGLSSFSTNRCIGVLLLTGTPMKNGKPCNLFPLLKAVNHPLGRDQKAYEIHFCNGIMKSFGRGKDVWDASGCSNLEQLKKLVASSLLHMTKEQCLNDLPPLTNISHDVPVSSRFQIQYERAVKDLVSKKSFQAAKSVFTFDCSPLPFHSSSLHF